MKMYKNQYFLGILMRAIHQNHKKNTNQNEYNGSQCPSNRRNPGNQRFIPFLIPGSQNPLPSLMTDMGSVPIRKFALLEHLFYVFKLFHNFSLIFCSPRRIWVLTVFSGRSRITAISLIDKLSKYRNVITV